MGDDGCAQAEHITDPEIDGSGRLTLSSYYVMTQNRPRFSSTAGKRGGPVAAARRTMDLSLRANPEVSGQCKRGGSERSRSLPPLRSWPLGRRSGRFPPLPYPPPRPLLRIASRWPPSDHAEGGQFPRRLTCRLWVAVNHWVVGSNPSEGGARASPAGANTPASKVLSIAAGPALSWRMTWKTAAPAAMSATIPDLTGGMRASMASAFMAAPVALPTVAACVRS